MSQKENPAIQQVVGVGRASSDELRSFDAERIVTLIQMGEFAPPKWQSTIKLAASILRSSNATWASIAGNQMSATFSSIRQRKPAGFVRRFVRLSRWRDFAPIITPIIAFSSPVAHWPGKAADGSGRPLVNERAP